MTGTLPENGFTSQGYGEKHLIHSTGDQMFVQQDCNRPELNSSSEERTSEGNQTTSEDVNGKVASSEAEEFICKLQLNVPVAHSQRIEFPYLCKNKNFLHLRGIRLAFGILIV